MVVQRPIVPVAAECTFAFVLQRVTYTLFSLNFCVLTMSQQIYTHSDAFVGEREGEHCLWDCNIIFGMNSIDSSLGMATSRKEYDVPKVRVKGEGINVETSYLSD